MSFLPALSRPGISRARAAGWLTGLFLAALPGAFFAAERPVLVLNNTDGPPYSTPEGDGFIDLVGGEVFRRAGLALKTVKLPAERGLINANAGIEDGDLSRIAGLERDYPNLVRVPEKIYDLEFVAITRSTRLPQPGWRALESLTVGYIKGWKIFERNLPPGVNSITTESPEQLLQLLARGRIDVALYERWMGLALARALNMPDIRVVEPPLVVREMYIYLHKRHAPLVPHLAAALRAVKRDGFYERTHRETLRPVRPAANP